MTITEQIEYVYNTLRKNGKKPNADHLMSMNYEDIYEMYEKLKKEELKKKKTKKRERENHLQLEIMKLNNETIREAVKLWLEDEASATKKYGFINDWDTSEVTDMSKLFLNAHEFNSQIGDWDVSNVTTMHAMFEDAIRFNQNINNWDVSNVTNMSNMFRKAKSFNQPLDNWDVSNVTNMSNMFMYAKSFNQPLNNWDVGNVTDISRMFADAKSFNQPLDNWDVSNVTKFINWNIKVEEYVKKFSFEIDKYKYLTKKSSIKINHDFKLDFKDNKFILIDYEWNGGNDFNYNIFNKEPLPEDVYINSFSSSELTVSVNGNTLYIKHFMIDQSFDSLDQTLTDGDYIGVSETKDFKNIEWYYNRERNNSELIKGIFLLCDVCRDEELLGYDKFKNDFVELSLYLEENFYKFDKVEINVEIDLKKLKKYHYTYE